MAYGADDVAAMMDGPLGIEVQYNGTCTTGFLDMEDVLGSDSTGEQVLVRQTVLRVLNGSITPTFAAILIADGVSYKVRDTQLEADGAILKVLVARA